MLRLSRLSIFRSLSLSLSLFLFLSLSFTLLHSLTLSRDRGFTVYSLCTSVLPVSGRKRTSFFIKILLQVCTFIFICFVAPKLLDLPHPFSQSQSKRSSTRRFKFRLCTTSRRKYHSALLDRFPFFHCFIFFFVCLIYQSTVTTRMTGLFRQSYEQEKRRAFTAAFR